MQAYVKALSSKRILQSQQKYTVMQSLLMLTAVIPLVMTLFKMSSQGLLCFFMPMMAHPVDRHSLYPQQLCWSAEAPCANGQTNIDIILDVSLACKQSCIARTEQA